MEGKINVAFLDDAQGISEGLRDLFLKVCQERNLISVNAYTDASKIYKDGEPDILIADACLGVDDEEDLHGLRECRNLHEYSGQMSRSIVLSQKNIPPFHENAWVASSIVKKSQHDDKDDPAIATLLKQAFNSDDVISDMKNILFGSSREMCEGVKERYDEYECIYPITFALRNAISEILVLHNTRYFWLGQPLRRSLDNLCHSPFWGAMKHKWHFWKEFDPKKRNHDEILQKSIGSIIDFYKEFLFSASDPKKTHGIMKLVHYFSACEPMLFAQSVKKGAPINYRDHSFHPFHSFLLGVLLIDWLIKGNVLKDKMFDKQFRSALTENADEAKGSPIWLQWFFAAIFHDVGYFLSKSEVWVADFCSMFLGRVYNKDSHLSEVFGQADYQSDISHLADLVESGNVSKKYNCCTANKNRSCTRSYFENQINAALRYDLDHGVLSALVFLTTYYAPPDDGPSGKHLTKGEKAEHRARVLRIKRAAVSSTDYYGLTAVDKRMADMHRDIVLPACLAIAVHHDVFQHYGPVQLEDDPLTFLLKFVDICQEYGRPTALQFGSDTCSGVNGGEVDLLGLQFINRKGKRRAECRVILGCRSQESFDRITSEASLLFGQHLVSKLADFSMILVNVSHDGGTVLFENYFVKENGSLVPNKKCSTNRGKIANLMWFSTWQKSVPSENANP